MPYKYLDHQADVGISAEGRNWQESFEEAARAMFNLIGKQGEKVATRLKSVEIEVYAKDIETLFVEWLNELLAQKDLAGLFFSDFKIEEIKKENKDSPDNNQVYPHTLHPRSKERGFLGVGVYKLKGLAFGRPFNEGNFVFGLDVKAATYSGLKCEERDGKFYCQCILDV